MKIQYANVTPRQTFVSKTGRATRQTGENVMNDTGKLSSKLLVSLALYAPKSGNFKRGRLNGPSKLEAGEGACRTGTHESGIARVRSAIAVF
jgi:hypothetical protein